MRIFSILCLSVLFLSCQRKSVPQPQIEPQNFIQFEYENLLDGQTGTIDNSISQRVEMFSFGSNSQDGARQMVRPVYHLTEATIPVEGAPQGFNFTFLHDMPIDKIEPVDGQHYGQLYTYTDRNDYLSEYFFTGPVTGQNREAQLSFQVGQIWTEAKFDGNPDNELVIESAQLFEDENGKQSIFVTGRFQATTIVTPSFNPIPIGTELFKITNGKFGFIRIVDGL